MKKPRVLSRLFWEFFKISTIVLGGGYAIVMTADEVFGKRLKLLEEDELLRRLPVFQSVPGLIASNSAIYTGVRVAGVAGGIAAVLGAALPSFLVINFIAMGYGKIPLDNRFLQGAFLGLRAAMCGIIIAALIKSWRGVMRGAYAWACMPIAVLAMLAFKIPPATVLII
ncbi:MAG: chromate transporter, partial [Kiritimatiellaeota bacterium]|nr:chromate transporter [Kiritimatiellota bacterium]